MRTQGKGSARRPTHLSEEAIAAAWDRTFSGQGEEPSDAEVADAEAEFAQEIAHLERLRPQG